MMHRYKSGANREDAAEVRRRFRAAVNMGPAAIAAFLKTDKSRGVGFKYPGRTESVGHASGRRIIRLLKKRAPYTPSDIRHMKKVAGYVARHLAQRPSGDVRDTRWRYSLMNWGHDPLKSR